MAKFAQNTGWFDIHPWKFRYFGLGAMWKIETYCAAWNTGVKDTPFLQNLYILSMSCLRCLHSNRGVKVCWFFGFSYHRSCSASSSDFGHTPAHTYYPFETTMKSFFWQFCIFNSKHDEISCFFAMDVFLSSMFWKKTDFLSTFKCLILY